MQAEFPLNNTIAETLPAFYKRYDLDKDGGHAESTIKIIVFRRFCFYLPNIEARRKVVLKHDIHHIITGYKSDFKGETEIGAWEIATGVKKYWVGLLLDMSSMIWGLFFNLPAVFRAYVRGSRTKSLYNTSITDDEAVVMTIDELRKRLGLDQQYPERPSSKELLSFTAWCVAGGIFSIMSVLSLPVLTVYSIVMALRERQGKKKRIQIF